MLKGGEEPPDSFAPRPLQGYCFVSCLTQHLVSLIFSFNRQGPLYQSMVRIVSYVFVLQGVAPRSDIPNVTFGRATRISDTGKDLPHDLAGGGQIVFDLQNSVSGHGGHAFADGLKPRSLKQGRVS